VRRPGRSKTGGRLARVGRGALGLFLVVSAGVACAQNPADLFWAAEAPEAVLGGGDVPGQITGRPEVERPTSLASAERPLVRLDLHSQTPLVLERGGKTVARWQTDVTAEECVIPLGPTHASQWTVGLRNRSSRGVIEDREADLDYHLSLDDHRRMLAVAYAGRPGWVFGCGLTDENVRATASGGSIADALRLPADTTRWPRMQADGLGWTVGVSRVGDRVQWGVQYAGMEPDAKLRVTRGRGRYVGHLPSEGRRVEAYAALNRGEDTFFVTGTDSRLQARGTLLMGLATRGDLGCCMHDSSVGVGWRRTRGSRTTQAMADWRRSSFETRDQGHTGLFPGIGSPVYGLEGDAQVSTISVRGGTEWRPADHWSLRAGLSVHHAMVDGQYRLRKSEGFGQNPETIAEGAIRDGALDMVALSLGLGYESRHWSCLLAASGAYAQANRALSGGGAGGPGGGGSHLKPQPLIAFTAEYRF